MSVTQQRKGRAGEQLLNKLGYTKVRAGDALNYGTMPDIYGLHGIHIECKRHETEAPTRWLKQAEKDGIEKFGDGIPAVFLVKKPRVLDRLHGFDVLVRTLRGRRERRQNF